MQTNRCFQVKVIRAPLLVGLLTGLAAVLALAEAAEDGFVEVVGVGFNSLVELKDGSLLSNDLRVSTDGGRHGPPIRPPAVPRGRVSCD